MAIIGCVYILTMLFLNFFTGFSYEQSIMPFSSLVSYLAYGIALVMSILTFFMHRNHLFYYIGLEVLVFSNLYTGRIYTALFVSSILMVILLFVNRLSSRLRVIIYLAIEIIKLALVIPYGAKSFFEYVGITLFSVCTIGCLNLLFRHAYDK